MKKNNKELEDLNIYKEYVQLMYYSYMITKKFPIEEKNALVADIKNTLTKGLEMIILAQKSYDVLERLKYLHQLDVNLKVLKVLVRISEKFKYITSHNYGSWSRKITAVTNLLGAWIKICRKQ